LVNCNYYYYLGRVKNEIFFQHYKLDNSFDYCVIVEIKGDDTGILYLHDQHRYPSRENHRWSTEGKKRIKIILNKNQIENENLYAGLYGVQSTFKIRIERRNW
jgi:hypothetical protein